MHWAEKIADRIIAKKPNKEEYVCAAGISPSGSIHIGNFRDIATSYFVVKALIKKGKKATIKATAMPKTKIAYQSKNKKVATVNSKGVVRGIRKGKTTILVTANGKTVKVQITVK